LTLAAGLCLAGAVLVKLIPALLTAGWFRRFGWRPAVVSLGVSAVVSVVFIQAWGGYTSPFLVTYLRDEESNAPLYFLATHLLALPLGIPDWVVRLALGGGLAAIALYLVVKRELGPYAFISKSFLLV